MKLYPKEMLFAQYNFSGRRNIDNKATSVIESVNSALKSGSKGLLSSSLLDKSISNLMYHANLLCKYNDRDTTQSLDSLPMWSKSKASHFLTELAKGLVMMEWEGRRKYWYVRINKDIWWVTLSKEETEKVYSPSVKHPKFCRVRVLNLVPNALKNSYLLCTCKKMERCGYVCRHILSVARELTPEMVDGVAGQEEITSWMQKYIKASKPMGVPVKLPYFIHNDATMEYFKAVKDAGQAVLLGGDSTR